MDLARAERTLRGMREFYVGGPAQAAGPAAGAALELFHDAARTVPAYTAFLRAAGVDPGAVRSAEDFNRLPLLTKDTYHRRYPLPELCRDGRLDGCDMVAVSSGSSGTPTVWPRSVLDERAVASRFEQVFRDGFRAGERRTLASTLAWPRALTGQRSGSSWSWRARCSVRNGTISSAAGPG